MWEWKLDLVASTAVAVTLLLLGQALKRRIHFFERFCIPSPVIGGFAMSLVMLLLYETGYAHVTFDTTLQSLFMVAFFTTVGIGGSLSLLRAGGSALIIYLLVCWALAFFQNGFGAWAAHELGLNPVLGVMAGAVSLEGGHGAAAAFGPMAEELGHAGATTVAIAAATFGLIAGGLCGGPLGSWLIRRNNLPVVSGQSAVVTPASQEQDADAPVTSQSLLVMMALILILMQCGALITDLFMRYWQFKLPAYVGAMFAAIIFRNVNDHLQLVRLQQVSLGVISDISLGIFLTMAMMTLKIWEVYDLALPLVLILTAQVTVLLLLTVFAIFPLLGRDYDAAVMCSGLIGHGLGATPNAMANMNAVCQRYGVVSYKAFLIIPLCGAVLVDMVAIPCHTWIINYLS